MITVGLVACAKTKSGSPQFAKDLYLSHLFMLASRYCEANYDAWYILSASHGLLEPNRIIEPYDETLKTFTPAARERWAERVIKQSKILLEKMNSADVVFYFHAGSLYAKLLAGQIGNSCLPMKGLGIGQQINWYLNRL
jgi:hypothetical protein